jgi:hypothetical protein
MPVLIYLNNNCNFSLLSMPINFKISEYENAYLSIYDCFCFPDYLIM